MDIVCNKRHFGAGGKLIPVGATSKGKPDGVYWVAQQRGKLEVATPKAESKPQPKQARTRK